MQQTELARFFPLPDFGLATRKPSTRDIPPDILAHMGVKLSVIAALAWDYTDTVISWAGGSLSLDKLKGLSRQVRRLKVEYDRRRSWSIDDESVRQEFDLAMLFETVCKDHLRKLHYGLRNELRAAYPDLDDNYFVLILAVQEAMTIIDTMVQFAAACDKTIKSYVVNKHSILCDELGKLRCLIPLFAGDCYCIPQSRRITAKVLLNEIKQIETEEVNV